MNKLVLILVLILAIFILGSMLLISLFSPKTKTPNQPQPVIQASFTPTPYKSPSPADIKALTLVSISPVEDINQTYFPIKQIFFTFNQSMNADTFTIETSPAAKIIVTLKPEDANTVVISPQEKWQPGITTFTISPATTSASGSKLDKPIVYKINTQFPENPPPDSPGL